MATVTVTGGEIVENNGSSDNLVSYTITLSAPVTQPVTVSYRAFSASADEAVDFDSVSDTVTIPAGLTTAQVTVRTEAESTVEADESVVVEFFNLSGADFANGQPTVSVLGVILDDDGGGVKRAVFVNEPILVEGDSGTTQAVFEIRLSQPSTQAITLDFATQDGTALAGADYTAATGTVTFAAGQTIQSVAVDVTGDTLVEGTQQFSLTVAPAATADGAQLAVDSAGGIATILDDDASTALPTVTITGGEIVENDGSTDTNVIYTITLSEASTQPVTIGYRASSSTADEAADFDSISDTVTLAAGQTTAFVSVRTEAELIVETDESVSVEFFNLSGAAFANGQPTVSVQGVILDDDGGGLKRAVFVSDPILVEGDSGSTEAVFEIRLSQPSDQPITLNYATRDGTALAGADYTAATGTVTFAAGQTIQSVAVDVTGDTLVEGTQQFSLTVAPAATADGAQLAVDSAGGIATILDDDASTALPTVTITGGEIVENDGSTDTNVIYTITLSEASTQPVTIGYRASSSTADEAADFDSISDTVTLAAGQTTAFVSVRTEAELIVETDESVSVEFFNLSGAAFANGQPTVSVQGVILDDDGGGLKRAVFVSDPILVEGDSGSTEAVFEIRLSQPSDQPITLNYATRDGTALAGADYTAATGTVTFAAGQTIQSVAVDVTGDTLVEGTQQFSLTVAPAATADGAQLAVDSAGGIATILDDDASTALPTVTITGGEIVENDGSTDTNVIYTITLSEASTQPVTIGYRASSSTADEAADFDSISDTVTLAAGQTTAFVSVRTEAELIVETDESVSVEFFNLSGAAFANGQPTVSVQGVILDDDGGGLKRAVFVSDPILVEGDSGSTEAVFEIRLSQPSDQPITLNYATRDGTALAGADYTAATGTVTFAAGQTIQSVAVDVTGDTLVEGTQQFSLTVAPAATADGAQLAVDSAGGIATILDDDASTALPTVTITGGEIVENDGSTDTNVIYTITLSEASTQPVTLEYNAISGTASATNDFDSISNTVTLAAGQTTALVSVRTVAETLVEADESVYVEFFNLAGATFANGQSTTSAIGVILDDDGTGLKRAVFVSDATIEEKADGSIEAVFEIRLSQPSDQPVTVSYTTQDGTATAGSDYAATTGSVTFAPGQTIQSVAVDILTTYNQVTPEDFQLSISTTSAQVVSSASSGVAEAVIVAPAAPNLAPVVSMPIPDQDGISATALAFSLPANAFTDPNGDALALTASQAGGAPLPSWLVFDAATGAFSGAPPSGFADTLQIEVTASDGSLSVADAFSLTISTAPDPVDPVPPPDPVDPVPPPDPVDPPVITAVGGGGTTLQGAEGNDVLSAAAGANTINGGGGNDVLAGGLDSDSLSGGSGNDILIGDNSDFISGADTLNGGTGDDLLEGGGGADTFVFIPGDGADTIGDIALDYGDLTNSTVSGPDFVSGVDTVALTGFGLTDGAAALALVTDVGGVATFSDQGTTITFAGLTAADLAANDFQIL